MANTIMSAKNSFQEGLIMDFAPDNTQATCMTSALNATLLTFNGNEMSLQNDMGNARVETAYLPEGYVPVGSCEFGDIVYIVSYNPLTNKSQIGCFPSPERNISSDELYENGTTGYQKLLAKDFQEINGSTPTGILKNNSVKKVLIDTKKLNPGDKYIIYSDTVKDNYDCLSDFGKSGKHNSLSKYLKLHVVSIEDSGKITYLDTTTQWYDMIIEGNSNNPNKYYISDKKIGKTNNDIDEYRSAIESNWSIFNSKVSGKLAILAELEMPETFSCSYDLELININNNYKEYKLTLFLESDPKISPSYICLNKAEFDNYDGIIVNGISYKSTTNIKDCYSGTNSPKYGWEYASSIELGTVKIPYILENGGAIKSDSFIYNLEVTPAMDYGILEHLTIPITIDFNKVGTGEVNLTTWKYYNTNDNSILTYSIDTYPKPNWEVTEVVIQFYDNQGLAAEYLLNGKKSYSGTFTEYFGLNGNKTNPRLSKNTGDRIIYHKGEAIDEIINDNIDNYTTENLGQVTEEYKGQIYLNDAGTLYSGFLYAAKIIVRQQHAKNSTLKDEKVQYRWYWTNPMFNEYYYSAKDFANLNFELVLNGEALFETNKNYIWKHKEINNLNNDFIVDKINNTNSANIQYIGHSKENNINMYINAGLQDDYGCFNLIQTGEEDDISNIDLKIYLSDSQINYSIPEKQYEFSVKEETPSNPSYLALTDVSNKEGNDIVAEKFSNYLDKPETLVTSSEVKDMFNIYFTSSVQSNSEKYEGSTMQVYTGTLNNCYYESQDNKKSIPLSMQAILFNKAYVQSENQGSIQVPVYIPIIDSEDDLSSLGINIVPSNGKISLGFKKAVALNHYKNMFSATLLSGSDNKFSNAELGDDDQHQFDGSNRLIDTATNTDFLNNIWGKINPNVNLFFPVYLGGYGSNNSGGTEHYNAIGGSTSNYVPTTGWRYNVGGQNAEQNNSSLTKGSFDIDGSIIKNIDTNNSISFLGVKYKNGMTVLNTAFLDGASNNSSQQFNQVALRDKNNINPDYDNFAYQLFLLLSNTYHKNKKIENQKIKLKNHVRNGDYDIELVKHIIIKLSAETGSGYKDMNIALRNIDFNDYKKQVITKIDNGLNAEDKNVKLRLLSFANDHELKIQVKSQPMSFFDIEVEAYIKRFGLLYPIDDLSPNNFYVYQEDGLQQYQSGTLTFSRNTVNDIVSHIFKMSSKDEPLLLGIRRPEIDIITPEILGYNKYIKLINDYISTYSGQQSFTYDNHPEAWHKREEFVNNIFDSLPDSIEGMTKIRMRDELETNSTFNNIFEVSNYAPYRFTINTYVQLEENKETKKADYYQFTTHNFLNIFDYQTSFKTKSTAQLGNTFGIKDGGSDENSAYTEFARDVLLDTNFQVV